MKSTRISLFPAALATASLVTAFATGALAQQTDNYELRAVPPPGKVVMDGKLDDWDLSGEILMCYDLGTLQDTYSVRAAAMYDADCVYFLLRFKDATPMVNHVDPKQEPGTGWQSDCIQLRMQTDRILHVDCYYFTDGKRPSCSIAYHDMARGEAGFEDKIEEAIGHGVDAAFQADADGKGYTQEMRIAWRLLRRDQKPMTAGQSFRCSIDALWGSDKGRGDPSHHLVDLVNAANPARVCTWHKNESWGEVKLMAKGRLAAINPEQALLKLQYGTEGPVALAYELPRAGAVTLVVEKADGTRVKNLISDVPREAGGNVDYWDGTDDRGQLVAPGEYRYRGLWHEELDALYQFSYGSPGDPAWETADGKGAWLADHEAPLGVCADDQRVYIAAEMAEEGSTLIGVDYEGKKQWGARGYGGQLARCGKSLYMLAAGFHGSWYREGEVRLIRLDPETGRFVSFANGQSDVIVTNYPPDRPVKPRDPDGAVVAAKAFDAEWTHREALGIAATSNRLYVSMFYENKILVVNPETAAVEGEFPLERPIGLATDRQGHLFAISGAKVVRLDAQGVATSVITNGLEAPIGLALDASGNLYVSDWQAAMCVKVFSPDGRFLRAIGCVGGRPLAGAYDPNGMFRPWGISVDAQNRLWVAEYDFAPKRVSVWSADGKFLKEFCGTTWYGATECAVNPFNLRQAFVTGNIAELDWHKGRWRITGTVWRPTDPQALLGPSEQSARIEFRKFNGRTLVIINSFWNHVSVGEVFPDRVQPLMTLGWIRGQLRNYQGGLQPTRFPDFFATHAWEPPVLEWAKQTYPNAFLATRKFPAKDFAQMEGQSLSRGNVRNQFIWSDRNGDGLVQEDEIQFYSVKDAGGVSWMESTTISLDAEFALHFPGGYYGNRNEQKLWRIPVKQWNKVGAPEYDVTAARPLRSEPGGLQMCYATWVDAQGNTLLVQAPMMRMIAPDGQVLWTYPNEWAGIDGAHRAPQDRRGLLIGTWRPIGSTTLGHGVGEIFCLNGNFGKAYFMTADGLYIGSLLRDTRSAPDALPAKPVRGMSINQTSPGVEWFGGEFFRNADDKKCYVGSKAPNAVLLSEVTGLETTRRLPVKPITFTQAQYDDARKLLAKHIAVKSIQKPVKLIRLAAVPALDGSGQGLPFDDLHTVRLKFDAVHGVEAALGYDDTNLYFGVRVTDDSPLLNQGKDWKALFKSGDAVLLELGPASRKGDGVAWQPGDLRLLFSVFDGKPIAVLYRYIVPGTPAPVEFTSGINVTKIDSVDILSNAHIGVRKTANGYWLDAAVPLVDLGIKPAKGQTYRGDLGVVYSDKAGVKNELRLLWSNPTGGLIADLANEARIQPEFWGIFEVE